MPWIPPSLIIGRVQGLRAAQYVRMSTDHQKYSTENQAAAIAAYALERNLAIVRTYIDNARSGLRISNRKALQDLIGDVQERRADFDFILVYDVSRWGRFQDTDESAYYEFICKKAGVRVLYCAEQFENDGTFVSAIMKNIKRVAAGDYSRDLSAKVFAGSCRMVKRGFKQGGTAGFGLQRVLVDQFGSPKCLLQSGDRKALLTDRVILQPGRPEQIATVRRVFRAFVIGKKSEYTIACDLNEEGILNEFGRPWRMLAIRRLLTDEKYLGNYVYNRKSGKLKSTRRSNPPEQWVRCEKAFEAIIDPAMFMGAGKIIERRPLRTIRAWKSDQEMLSRLDSLLREKGHLSADVIDNADNLPRNATYIARFGSLRRAYELIGYHPDAFKSSTAKRTVRAVTNALAEDLGSRVQAAGVAAVYEPAFGRLTIGPDLTVSIVIARCQQQSKGFLRWPIVRRIDRAAGLVLAVRMKEGNIAILDYYLLPTKRALKPKLAFRIKQRARLEPYRIATLDAVADALQGKATS
jgi:DNA invertase Pin-like site-specific DNA recombinase